MKQTANVVLHNGKLAAEVVRSEACQSCHACQFGQQERVYVDVDIPCKEGDTVIIELDNGKFSKASLIAYGIPVLMCFVALFAASLFTENELIQAAFALFGLVIGLTAVRIFEKKARRSGSYRPKITLADDTDK